MSYSIKVNKLVQELDAIKSGDKQLDKASGRIAKSWTKDGEGVLAVSINYDFLLASFLVKASKKGHKIKDLDIDRIISYLNSSGDFNIKKIAIIGNDSRLNKDLAIALMRLGHFAEIKKPEEVNLSDYDDHIIDGIITMHGVMLDLRKYSIYDLFPKAMYEMVSSSLSAS